MSSWVENQRSEAFFLWRRYLAMGLHFRDGSGFDYAAYNGSTNATVAGFLKRPKTEVAKFISLTLKLKTLGIEHDEFLFANARSGTLWIDGLLKLDSLKKYRDWKSEWGTASDFGESVRNRLTPMIIKSGDPGGVLELVMRLLSSQDPTLWYEVVSYIFVTYPKVADEVATKVADNALYKIHYDRILKHKKLYQFLFIL